MKDKSKNSGWVTPTPIEQTYNDKPSTTYPEGTFPGLSKDYGKSGPKELPTNTPACCEDDMD